MRIREITWDKGTGLEDLAINGIGPLQCLAEYISLFTKDEEKILETIGLMEGVLEDIKECLYRFLGEYKKSCSDIREV